MQGTDHCGAPQTNAIYRIRTRHSKELSQLVQRNRQSTNVSQTGTRFNIAGDNQSNPVNLVRPLPNNDTVGNPRRKRTRGEVQTNALASNYTSNSRGSNLFPYGRVDQSSIIDRSDLHTRDNGNDRLTNIVATLATNSARTLQERVVGPNEAAFHAPNIWEFHAGENARDIGRHGHSGYAINRLSNFPTTWQQNVCDDTAPWWNNHMSGSWRSSQHNPQNDMDACTYNRYQPEIEYNQWFQNYTSLQQPYTNYNYSCGQHAFMNPLLFWYAQRRREFENQHREMANAGLRTMQRTSSTTYPSKRRQRKSSNEPRRGQKRRLKLVDDNSGELKNKSDTTISSSQNSTDSLSKVDRYAASDVSCSNVYGNHNTSSEEYTDAAYKSTPKEPAILKNSTFGYIPKLFNSKIQGQCSNNNYEHRRSQIPEQPNPKCKRCAYELCTSCRAPVCTMCCAVLCTSCAAPICGTCSTAACSAYNTPLCIPCCSAQPLTPSNFKPSSTPKSCSKSNETADFKHRKPACNANPPTPFLDLEAKCSPLKCMPSYFREPRQQPDACIASSPNNILPSMKNNKFLEFISKWKSADFIDKPKTCNKEKLNQCGNNIIIYPNCLKKCCGVVNRTAQCKTSFESTCVEDPCSTKDFINVVFIIAPIIFFYVASFVSLSQIIAINKFTRLAAVIANVTILYILVLEPDDLIAYPTEKPEVNVVPECALCPMRPQCPLSAPCPPKQPLKPQHNLADTPEYLEQRQGAKSAPV